MRYPPRHIDRTAEKSDVLTAANDVIVATLAVLFALLLEAVYMPRRVAAPSSGAVAAVA